MASNYKFGYTFTGSVFAKSGGLTGCRVIYTLAISIAEQDGRSEKDFYLRDAAILEYTAWAETAEEVALKNYQDKSTLHPIKLDSLVFAQKQYGVMDYAQTENMCFSGTSNAALSMSYCNHYESTASVLRLVAEVLESPHDKTSWGQLEKWRAMGNDMIYGIDSLTRTLFWLHQKGARRMYDYNGNGRFQVCAKEFQAYPGNLADWWKNSQNVTANAVRKVKRAQEQLAVAA